MLGGWLFADLLLAFAVIVLGSSTGNPSAASATTTTISVPTTTTTTTPAPTPTSPPGIAPEPVVFQPDASYSVLMGPDGPEREAERQRIRDHARLFFGGQAESGSRAGFVLSFGIHPETGVGQEVAAEYNRLLLESIPEVFDGAKMRTFDSRTTVRQGGANVEVYFLT